MSHNCEVGKHTFRPTKIPDDILSGFTTHQYIKTPRSARSQVQYLCKNTAHLISSWNSLSAQLCTHKHELGRPHWIGSLNLTRQLFMPCHVNVKLLRIQFPDVYRGLLQKTDLLSGKLWEQSLEEVFLYQSMALKSN